MGLIKTMTNMKTLRPLPLLLLALLLAASGLAPTATAQKTHKKHFDREAFFARRNAYITAEAGLTADEAAAFIPLENELQRRKFEVGRECRRLARKNRSQQGLTDRERRELSDCLTETRMEEARLEKEYFERFKKILSVEKLSKYQQAEAEFLRKFLQDHRPEE